MGCGSSSGRSAPFCALPPDSADSFSPGSLGLTSKVAPSARASRTMAPLRMKAPRKKRPTSGRNMLLDDRQAVDAAGTLPIGRQQGEAHLDRAARTERGLGEGSGAVYGDFARACRTRAKGEIGHFLVARADKSGETEDFALCTASSEGSSILPARLLNRA